MDILGTNGLTLTFPSYRNPSIGLLCNKNQMTGFYVIDIKTDLKLVKDILLKQNFSYRLQQLIMYVIPKNVLNNNFFHRV